MAVNWGKLSALAIAGYAFYALYQSGRLEGLLTKSAEVLKRADTGVTGAPLMTNYGSVAKVETDAGNSAGQAVGQTMNYSASRLPDSSSWAADARVVAAVGQNYGAAIGQSV